MPTIPSIISQNLMSSRRRVRSQMKDGPETILNRDPTSYRQRASETDVVTTLRIKIWCAEIF